MQPLGHVDWTATISSMSFTKRSTNRDREIVQFCLSTHDDGLVARFDGPAGEDEALCVFLNAASVLPMPMHCQLATGTCPRVSRARR